MIFSVLLIPNPLKIMGLFGIKMTAIEFPFVLNNQSIDNSINSSFFCLRERKRDALFDNYMQNYMLAELCS